MSEILPSKPGDKDVVKKTEDATRQSLFTRCQEEDIKTMLHAYIYVAMLLDPQFKKAPMLTAEKKASIISFMKCKLEVCILDD